jgi:peptidyl-tRNA hydrolase
MTPGYVAVQSCHAIADLAYDHPNTFKKWKEDTNSIICLSVKDEEALLKLFEKYSKLTPSTKFYEPDVNAYTAICLYGTPEVRRSLSHLPLVLKQKINS